MKPKAGFRTIKFLLLVALVLVMELAGGGGLGYAAQTAATAEPGIDYFKGTWTVSIKGGPAGGFRWELKEALDGSWLGGVVERDGQKITNDYWRQNGKKIDRFAFTVKGLFVNLSSPGWKGDTLAFTGTASDQNGEFPVRETITKITTGKFLALWERPGPDGKWSTFSDETCTRRAA